MLPAYRRWSNQPLPSARFGMLFVVVVRRVHEGRMERRGAGRPGW